MVLGRFGWFRVNYGLGDREPELQLIRDLSAKFPHRPERFQRNLKNGLRMSDDLIWEDRQKKKKLREVMKQAYDEGKKVRFHHGNLYFDGFLYKTGT